MRKAGAGLGELGGARAGIIRGRGSRPKGVGEPPWGCPAFYAFAFFLAQKINALIDLRVVFNSPNKINDLLGVAHQL